MKIVVASDIYHRTVPAEVYLARPGKRLVGRINGIREDSANCQINLNNTSTLQISIDRNIDGKLNPLYDKIQVHYELRVTGIGWFKINEDPEIDNDGSIEYKMVRAESLEIELQQYDLVDFKINTGTEDSKEMLATDNTYDESGYTLFREQVKFYRDTAQLEDLASKFAETGGTTIDDLKHLIAGHTDILLSPRLKLSSDNIDSAIDLAVADRKANGLDTSVLEASKGRSYTIQSAKTLCDVFPELCAHLPIEQQRLSSDDANVDYSVADLIQRQIAHEHELSFLWLVLHEHGWSVGYVDDTIDPSSPDEQDREYLKDRIGTFEIESQDIYSFLTKTAAQYYRCIFIFDTEHYKVHAYKMEGLGLDTNISLNFHNIQNSVTRTQQEDLYTVFQVAGDDLDIREVNFGSNEIEDLSYFMNTDHFDQQTIDKYQKWVQFRKNNRKTYSDLSLKWRNQSDKVAEIQNRVPLDGTDTDQYKTFTDEELSLEKHHYEAELAAYEKTAVDEDGHFSETILKDSSPTDYANYILIKNQIIPNIDIEMSNRQLENSKDDKEFLDGYKYDFKIYGDSYGVTELENQLTMLKNSLSVLEKKGYNKPDESDEYHQQEYLKYQKYKKAYDECQDALNTRKEELKKAESELESLSAQMENLRTQADRTNAQFGFTTKELALLDKYAIHTDYQNENFAVYDTSTNEQIIQTKENLYGEAVDALYAKAHPQWKWSTTQDNLYLIPQFKGWYDALQVGNFIRIAMREDYMVKLRVIQIAFNPFMMDSSINLTFSNMVQYRAKRNDFITLLSNSSPTGKNRITGSVSKKAGTDNTFNVDTNLLLRLFNNSTFGNYLNAAMGNATAQSITAVSGNIGTLVSNQISAANIDVTKITGDEADFDKLFSKYIDTQYIAAKLANIDEANVKTLFADNAFTQNLKAMNISVSKIVGDEAEFNSFFADHVSGNVITAKLANLDSANIKVLFADNEFTQNLQSLSSTSAKAVIDDAYIKEAVAGKITVADLAAGDITLSDSMRILSQNGSLVMNGTALQISGKEKDSSGNVIKNSDGTDKTYVGVQLGYDTNSDPSLILRNSKGATVITPEGITKDAIADQLIVNNMVKDGTLSESKLGFSVMKPNDQGGIDISQVYDGTEKFGVSYTKFTQNTDESLKNLDQKIDQNATYELYIQMPRGNKMSPQGIYLNAKLFKNSVDVTDSWGDQYFTWTRHSKDEYGDTYWNRQHETGTKSLYLTSNDIVVSASFECRFQANGLVVSTNG